MEEGGLDQSMVIRGDVVNGRIMFRCMIRAANAHDRHVNATQQLFNHGVVKVSDDPVAQPVFDVLQTGTEIFFDENIPFGLRRLQIFANPFNHLPVIGFVGIE
ncbi:Uncharacterised protein [Enterobacter cloacae]|nr:Uncharacterised protein [Enterobacter cloacae]